MLDERLLLVLWLLLPPFCCWPCWCTGVTHLQDLVGLLNGRLRHSHRLETTAGHESTQKAAASQSGTQLWLLRAYPNS